MNHDARNGLLVVAAVVTGAGWAEFFPLNTLLFAALGMAATFAVLAIKNVM